MLVGLSTLRKARGTNCIPLPSRQGQGTNNDSAAGIAPEEASPLCKPVTNSLDRCLATPRWLLHIQTLGRDRCGLFRRKGAKFVISRHILQQTSHTHASKRRQERPPTRRLPKACLVAPKGPWPPWSQLVPGDGNIPADASTERCRWRAPRVPMSGVLRNGNDACSASCWSCCSTKTFGTTVVITGWYTKGGVRLMINTC